MPPSCIMPWPTTKPIGWNVDERQRDCGCFIKKQQKRKRQIDDFYDDKGEEIRVPSYFVCEWSGQVVRADEEEASKVKFIYVLLPNVLAVHKAILHKVFGSNQQASVPLPTPLQHVRRIVIRCPVEFPYGKCVSRDEKYCSAFYDDDKFCRFAGDYASSGQRKQFNFKVEEEGSTSDEGGVHLAPIGVGERYFSDSWRRFRRVDVISKKFPQSLAPLVRVIAKRFVGLQQLMVVCQWNNDRKIVYDLSDAVLAERAERTIM